MIRRFFSERPELELHQYNGSGKIVILSEQPEESPLGFFTANGTIDILLDTPPEGYGFQHRAVPSNFGGIYSELADWAHENLLDAKGSPHDSAFVDALADLCRQASEEKPSEGLTVSLSRQSLVRSGRAFIRGIASDSMMKHKPDANLRKDAPCIESYHVMIYGDLYR